MTRQEKERIVDDVIYMMCDGKSAKEIADALNINETAVKALESKLNITRF